MKQNYRAQFLSVLLVVVLVLFALPLGACSKGKEDFSDTYNAKTDFDYTTFCQGSPRYIARTESGCYFAEGEFLFYSDNGSNTVNVVCSKPNCLHQEETNAEQVWRCDGFYQNVNNICMIDNCLYIACGDMLSLKDDAFYLYQVSNDGSSRKKMFEMPKGTGDWLIHRGYIYCGVTTYSASGDEHGKILRKKLSVPDSDYEVLWEDEASIQDLYAYGKHLYFCNTKLSVMQIKHVDLVNLECTDFYRTQHASEIIDFCIFKGQMYIEDAVWDRDSNCRKSCDVFTANLDGSSPVAISSDSDLARMCMKQNILASSENYLFAWQRNGETADADVHGLSVYDANGKEIAYSDDIIFSYQLFTDDGIYSTRDGQLIYWSIANVENGKMVRTELLNIDSEKLYPECFVPNGDMNQ